MNIYYYHYQLQLVTNHIKIYTTTTTNYHYQLPLIVATAYSVRAAMMVPDEDGTGRRSRAYPAVRSNSEAR